VDEERVCSRQESGWLFGPDNDDGSPAAEFESAVNSLVSAMY